jgi:hypothetical protein
MTSAAFATRFCNFLGGISLPINQPITSPGAVDFRDVLQPIDITRPEVKAGLSDLGESEAIINYGCGARPLNIDWQAFLYPPISF